MSMSAVEWKKLWQVTIWDKRFSGIDKKLQPKVIKYHYYLANELKELERTFGDIRILYTTEQVAYTDSILVSNNISEGEIVAIPWGGNASVKYFKGKFITADNRIATSSDIATLNNKYLYYWMLHRKDELEGYYRGAGIKHPSMYSVLMMDIPIPSLAKQQEIVSHLDTFTTLISNLESELDMRRKQYEHYRNQLLDFEGVEGVEWKSLGELSLKITDGAHSSPKSTNEGYYMPSVKDMTDNGFDFSDCKIISKEDYEDLKRIGCQPNLNDILIAKDGSMLKYVFVVKEKLDIVVLSSIAIITPKIELVMPEYLVCYLKQSSFQEIVIRDYSSKGGVPRIILKNFKKIVIPIPSLKTQQEIVSKLDAFENLIQSLEQEIKLRKQQYEYYREKLLTFEKD